ncbi:MAG: hypothetical protein R2941_11525 [Desulfobacterales bacterium]
MTWPRIRRSPSARKICAANDDGVKGIALPIRNIGAIQYLEENSSIYVQGVGDYGSSWSGRDPEYSGGIVRIDPRHLCGFDDSG